MLASESAGHSRKVRRRRFDVTTVRGPLGEERVCLVYRLINDLISVLLPTCLGRQLCTVNARCWPYPRRAHDSHDDRRRLLWETIHEWHMETLLSNLGFCESMHSNLTWSLTS